MKIKVENNSTRKRKNDKIIKIYEFRYFIFLFPFNLMKSKVKSKYMLILFYSRHEI